MVEPHTHDGSTSVETRKLGICEVSPKCAGWRGMGLPLRFGNMVEVH